MNDYEQRKQDRIDRLREKASKARAQSDALSRQSWDMISAIPSGQPVMGAADARYRERAGNKMRQSVAASDKADYYERRAQAAENNTAISSDDPEAIAKLTEKLEELKQTQEFMKAVNAYYKKNGTCQGFPGLSDEEAAKLEGGMEYHPWDKKPFASFALSNNNQNIRTTEKRIQKLTQAKELGYTGWTFEGGRVEANQDKNRLQIFFDEIPSEDVRQELKSRGFRWARSEGAWQRQLGRQVKKGEKGIQILAPCNFRATLEREKIDPLSGQTIYGPDGKPLTEKVKISPNRFKIAHVFDLSQTEGRELPQIGVSELSGDVADYTGIYDWLTALSPLPVMQEAFERSAKGYTSFMENRIVIKPGMSQVQTIKTLVHEIAHAKLHQPQDLLAVPSPAEKRRKEVEAESIAYVVCQHFGIDTTDYSLAYVASWSKGTELAELKASLNVIHSTAGEIIDAISPPPPKLERTQEQRPRQKGKRRAQKTRR